MTNTAANCTIKRRPVHSCGLRQYYVVHDNESFLHTGDKRGGFQDGNNQTSTSPKQNQAACSLAVTLQVIMHSPKKLTYFFILGKYFPQIFTLSCVLRYGKNLKFKWEIRSFEFISLVPPTEYKWQIYAEIFKRAAARGAAQDSRRY